MNKAKYVGMDVHKASVVIAVISHEGSIAMQAMVETKASSILGFIKGLEGRVEVTFEEGTQAAWLYDLIRPHVTKVVVCDPRRNALLNSGNKRDPVDALKLAQLLRADLLVPVYHGEHGTRVLKELVRNYDGLVGDSTRVKNRIKALYRGQAIPDSGKRVYGSGDRAAWLQKLSNPGQRTRAEYLFQQLDALRALRKAARRAMLAESRKQAARATLEEVPGLGPVRASQIIAVVDTPHRFRTKRQFWAYIGLAVVTRMSAENEMVNGQWRRVRKPLATRGLNRNHNRTLKYVFKSAALSASHTGALKPYYDGLVAKGMRPELARVTLARKLAAITLALWKKGGHYQTESVTQQVVERS